MAGVALNRRWLYSNSEYCYRLGGTSLVQNQKQQVLKAKQKQPLPIWASERLNSREEVMLMPGNVQQYLGNEDKEVWVRVCDP